MENTWKTKAEFPSQAAVPNTSLPRRKYSIKSSLKLCLEWVLYGTISQTAAQPLSSWYIAKKPDVDNKHDTLTKQIFIVHTYYVSDTKLGSDITPELPFKISKGSLHA